VAPGHENALPAGRPKVLAIVGVLPLGETALVTLRSMERFNMGTIIAAGTDIINPPFLHPPCVTSCATYLV
jgi:hypothetical protein